MGMTAEEFRRRRLSERRGETASTNRQAAIGDARWSSPDDVLSDMGSGDMFGSGGGVWTPPVANGYRCEALARLRGRTTKQRLIQSRIFNGFN